MWPAFASHAAEVRGRGAAGHEGVLRLLLREVEVPQHNGERRSIAAFLERRCGLPDEALEDLLLELEALRWCVARDPHQTLSRAGVVDAQDPPELKLAQRRSTGTERGLQELPARHAFRPAGLHGERLALDELDDVRVPGVSDSGAAAGAAEPAAAASTTTTQAADPAAHRRCRVVAAHYQHRTSATTTALWQADCLDHQAAAAAAVVAVAVGGGGNRWWSSWWVAVPTVRARQGEHMALAKAWQRYGNGNGMVKEG